MANLKNEISFVSGLWTVDTMRVDGVEVKAITREMARTATVIELSDSTSRWEWWEQRWERVFGDVFRLVEEDSSYMEQQQYLMEHEEALQEEWDTIGELLESNPRVGAALRGVSEVRRELGSLPWMYI